MESIIANHQPIIGILAQETYSIQKLVPNEGFRCFICANYVKYVECAGARVLPIWIGQSRAYYERVVDYTNGLLFPGGATYFTEANGYGEAGVILYELALRKNEAGVYYPIWGTCLGMQFFMYAALNCNDMRITCKAQKISLALEFKEDYKESKLFRDAPPNLIENLRMKPITYNHHQFGIAVDDFLNARLDQQWRILSVNQDRDNLTFISIFESRHNPFYGVQFHPEKHQFSFVRDKNIPHCRDSIEMGQYFANFFVRETQKNGQTFPSSECEHANLIHNFHARYTGHIPGSIYDQLYLFTDEDCDSHLL